MSGPAGGGQGAFEDDERASTIVGSEDGFRLREEPACEMDDSEADNLLGAGTQNEDTRSRPQSGVWEGADDFVGEPWYRQPSVYWLVGPYMLFTLAFGGSIVPKLNLIVDLVCKRYFADRTLHDPSFIAAPVVPGAENPQCKTPEVQRHVATFMLVLSVITGVLSSFSAPKLGSLSDRYGRKYLLALTSCGGVLGEVVIILAGKYPDVFHYRWIILGAIFDGLSGSFTAGSLLGHSYVSDCTPPSKRGVAIGYLHACLFTGLAFGPLMAGYFVRWTGSLLSIFYITLGCHLFFILFIALILPESLSRKRQRLARDKHSQEQESLNEGLIRLGGAPGDEQFWLYTLWAAARKSNPFAPLKILVPSGPGASRVRRNLLLYAAIDTILLGAAMSSGQVTLLYSEFMFDWGNFETSRFISLVSMVRVFVLMAIFPVVNYYFRVRPARRLRLETGVRPGERNAGADKLDVWLLRFAIFSDIIGVAGYIFVRTPALFVLCGVITAFGGLGSATIQASLSKHVPSQMLGQLLGAIGLLHALSRVFAPILFNGLYAATVGHFSQAIFVLLTVLFCFLLLFSFFIRPHVYLKEEDIVSAAPRSSPEEDNLVSDETLTDDEIIPRI
ncbi:uncharacterized protein E0L32_008554 [Thyridium curvatum]|uniref:Major facilitator superfamily (MFS) profile domain-containing protein n=1 Tax=Thyridium curvatum TaxID=1093900 RepID=A0A507AVI5_9PEZI|nr:uncharacterized protein E0L32_008554 [Thyridium curvatum]TPX10504.1 hypothetical protein E0L32_008554 [Thyridium curvatum]